jgi:hypothetical protein
VVWFNRLWFGESPADIHNFFNSAFNFKLNYQVLNRLAPKGFEFAEIFSKPTSSNPLLLLDNRCLRVALRAFENRKGATSLVLKPASRLPTINSLLKSGQHSAHHFFMAGQWQSRWF